MSSACGYSEQGIASWYGPGFHGKRTSSGETYDMNAMSAAHKTLPIPVMVRVTNLENNKSMILRVNDRGPFHEGRIIDLSKAAAKHLDVIAKGTARVQVDVIGEANAQAANTNVSRDYRNRMFIQMGSYSSFDNAEKMLQRLQSNGYNNTNTQQISIDGRVLYRVRIGPVTSSSSADMLYEELSSRGYHGHTIITE